MRAVSAARASLVRSLVRIAQWRVGGRWRRGGVGAGAGCTTSLVFSVKYNDTNPNVGVYVARSKAINTSTEKAQQSKAK